MPFINFHLFILDHLEEGGKQTNKQAKNKPKIDNLPGKDETRYFQSNKHWNCLKNITVRKFQRDSVECLCALSVRHHREQNWAPKCHFNTRFLLVKTLMVSRSTGIIKPQETGSLLLQKLLVSGSANAPYKMYTFRIATARIKLSTGAKEGRNKAVARLTLWRCVCCSVAASTLSATMGMI